MADSADPEASSSVHLILSSAVQEFEVTPRDLSHVDIQGIPWRLSEMTRERFRASRLQEYADFERRRHVRLWNRTGDNVKEIGMYTFQMMNRMDSCSINHFQLRHLLSCPSLRAVYFPHLNRVRKWDPTLNRSEVAVEYQEATLPRISTCVATPDCVLVGGLGGELLVVPNGQIKAKWLCLVSQDTDNMVTHISPHSQKRSCLVSSNDAILRQFSLSGLRLEQSFRLDWSINASELSPSGHAICVVGDASEGLLLDPRSGKEISKLKGHLDFSFSCAWSPDSRWIVTGNQDHTARVYDTRFIRDSDGAFKVLQGEMAAIRCVQFAPDSSSLALMEADDFVHIYDVHSGFEHGQLIDFFGETAGVGYSPDSEHFYVGIAGMERGGVFEYRRDHSTVYNRFKSLIL